MTSASPPEEPRAQSFWRSAEEPPAEPPGRRRIGGVVTRWITRERPVPVSPATVRWLTVAFLLATYVALLIYYEPRLLLSTTTPTGGDTGAHVYAPWYLKHHLIPKGLLSGWSPGWYAGFPILHFYFPLIATFQAVLSYVIPYEVAFKLGTIIGPFFLPISAYVMFRLIRFPFPAPLLALLSAFGFLLMDSFTIYGGNIPSALAGEYSFSLSVGLSLIVLGLLYRLLTEDRGSPILTSVVLALAVLAHLLPVIMIVLSLPVLVYPAVRTYGVRRTAVRLAIPLGVAFSLTAWWAIPFLVRLPYSADMSWFPLEGLGPIAPRELWPYLVGFALAGIVALLRLDRRFLVVMTPALIGLVIYLVLPQGPVWNGRFLPFWYLGAHLASAYLVATMLPFLARAVWRRRMAASVTAMVAVIGLGVSIWAVWHRRSTFIDDWIRHNYGGYENTQQWPTFERLMQRLDALPPGRVMWEPHSDLSRFGTPIAFMTIPYWTDQATMEGIYFESSMTTPFHFVLASEVAESPSNPIPGLPYSEFDLNAGIDHMELFDISYFIAFSEKAHAEAQASERLTPIADVGDLGVFGLESHGQVVIPRYEPVVLEDAHWVDENLEWFGGDLDVPLVSEGPDGWERVNAFREGLPRNSLARGGESVEVEVDDDAIRFTTEAVGVPHWVKTSYFPNWRAEGAEGPYLASPSLMLVIPTQEQVSLTYERTWAEWLGLALTAAGIVAIALPWTRRRLRTIVTR